MQFENINKFGVLDVQSSQRKQASYQGLINNLGVQMQYRVFAFGNYLQGVPIRGYPEFLSEMREGKLIVTHKGNIYFASSDFIALSIIPCEDDRIIYGGREYTIPLDGIFFTARNNQNISSLDDSIVTIITVVDTKNIEFGS